MPLLQLFTQRVIIFCRCFMYIHSAVTACHTRYIYRCIYRHRQSSRAVVSDCAIYEFKLEKLATLKQLDPIICTIFSIAAWKWSISVIFATAPASATVLLGLDDIWKDLDFISRFHSQIWVGI